MLIKCKKCQDRKIKGTLRKAEGGSWSGTIKYAGQRCQAFMTLYRGGVFVSADCGNGNFFNASGFVRNDDDD